MVLKYFQNCFTDLYNFKTWSKFCQKCTNLLLFLQKLQIKIQSGDSQVLSVYDLFVLSSSCPEFSSSHLFGFDVAYTVDVEVVDVKVVDLEVVDVEVVDFEVQPEVVSDVKIQFKKLN